MTRDIEISRNSGIQSLRLNRAAKKNALTAEMYRALADALQSGDQAGDVAVHVLLGSDGVFCAGNDINDFLASARAGGEAPAEDILRFIRLLPVVDKPLLAGVDGPAVGIGTTLLFHCDLVYATPSAAFATPFLDLGLVPEAASSLLAPARMGYARAFELLVLGETFSAERAREAGLVNQIVPAPELERTVLAAAERLAQKPIEALRLARRLLRADPAAILARTDEEAALFRGRLTSPEALVAFRAFLDKRPPGVPKP